DRIGLIAFAGSAFLECPLTIDYSGFLLALNDIGVDTIPRGGTAIAGAIREAIQSYRGATNKQKVLILISDGEDHEGDPFAAAQEAKNAGIVIFTIGVGSTDGDLIFVEESGGKKFLKDESGNAVKSRLNEEALEKIALITGGSYIRSTPTAFGLDMLYEEKLSKFEKQEFEGKMKKHFTERFQIPLALACLLLVMEVFLRDTR
ncbi:MAG: VWA domain-containing protein, partial [Candidatus Omnitrophica bacterium]|nr:VWA domain-containing protein [Candidatus Omnitrophota bacterium]